MVKKGYMCWECCPRIPVTEEEKEVMGGSDKFEKKKGKWHTKRGKERHTMITKDVRKPTPAIIGVCAFLTDDNLCSVYDKRPKICRDYECEHQNQEE